MTRAADRLAADPHVPLMLAVLIGLVAEVLLWAGPFREGQDAGHVGWVALAALVVAGPLTLALRLDHRDRDRGGPGLRAGAVVAAACVLLAGLLAVGALVGGTGPSDLVVYQGFGAEMLDTGGLPQDPAAEYPPLAIAFFAACVALDRLLPIGFGVTFGLVMVVVGTTMWWLVARRAPAWAVAATALWPTVAVFALVRYDALPTLLLVGGLVTASRRDPGDGDAAAGGLLLGLGAAAKWFPGLAAAVLVVGWWRSGRRRLAAILAAATAVGFLVPHLPFLASAGQRKAVIDAYRFHADRVMTGESLPFLPLHLLGIAPLPERPWGEVALPAAAEPFPTAVLVAALVIPLVLAAWRPRHVMAWAVLAPIAFLLGNRIFSPQFLLPLAALWALSAAGGSVTLRQRLAAMALMGVAATANWGIWPVFNQGWVALSWVLFTAALVLTVLGVGLMTRAQGGNGRWGRAQQGSVSPSSTSTVPMKVAR